MRLPRNLLPLDPILRHSALREYFCDKDASAVLDGHHWKLSLSWPNDPDRHVDPRIGEGLKWWGGGLSHSQMALARRREGRVLTVLYDSWTLHSWSEWLVRSGHNPRSPVTILHVDDHRDLAVPRVALSDNAGWFDLISRRPVSLQSPSSVMDAIESGAVGMGSFMTPWLHGLSAVDVRHLCQPPKVKGPAAFDIKPGFIADELLVMGAPRLAVDFCGNPSSLLTYRVTSDFGDWISEVGDAPILVHIDMDYFNNRYDGDSDWRFRAEMLDPTEAEIDRKVNELADTLLHPRIAEKIQDIVIAFSPGFFPGEHWKGAGDLLRARLSRFYES